MKSSTKEKHLLVLQTLSIVLDGNNKKALLWAVKLAKEETKK